jgi:hypothetical protein
MSRYTSTTRNRLWKSRKVKNRHIGLSLVDDPQQLLKDLTDSWRVPWAVGRQQFKIIASEANDSYSAGIGRAHILHDFAQILLDKNGNTLRHSR